MVNAFYILRILSFILFISRSIYWIFTGKKANNHKRKTQSLSSRNALERYLTDALAIFIMAQLLGWNIFSFSSNIILRVIGFVLVLSGFMVSIFARKTFGINWAHAAEYQIKKGHVLVTSGYYSYFTRRYL